MVCKDLHPDNPRIGFDTLPQERGSLPLDPGLDRRSIHRLPVVPVVELAGVRHVVVVAICGVQREKVE